MVFCERLFPHLLPGYMNTPPKVWMELKDSPLRGSMSGSELRAGLWHHCHSKSDVSTMVAAPSHKMMYLNLDHILKALGWELNMQYVSKAPPAAIGPQKSLVEVDEHPKRHLHLLTTGTSGSLFSRGTGIPLPKRTPRFTGSCTLKKLSPPMIYTVNQANMKPSHSSNKTALSHHFTISPIPSTTFRWHRLSAQLGVRVPQQRRKHQAEKRLPHWTHPTSVFGSLFFRKKSNIFRHLVMIHLCCPCRMKNGTTPGGPKGFGFTIHSDSTTLHYWIDPKDDLVAINELAGYC